MEGSQKLTVIVQFHSYAHDMNGLSYLSVEITKNPSVASTIDRYYDLISKSKVNVGIFKVFSYKLQPNGAFFCTTASLFFPKILRKNSKLFCIILHHHHCRYHHRLFALNYSENVVNDG